MLNLRFTGDLPRHEAEIRAVWGGALCVSEAGRPLSELHALQSQLHGELDALSSAVDETRGIIVIRTVVADDELQTSLDERYGAGTVEVTGALQPVR